MAVTTQGQAKKQPQMPDFLQTQFNTQKLNNATAQDLATKYGFDYSPEYARRQAEAEAQVKRLGTQRQVDQLNADLKNYQSSLDQSFYLQGLNQQQNQVNTGMNAGISQDQNLRLAMNKQNNLGQYQRSYQAQMNALQQQLSGIESERMARQESIYQTRLNEMLKNALALRDADRSDRQLLMQQNQFDRNMQFDYYKFNKQQDLAYKQLQEQIRQFNTEQDWREYTYRNMSASEQARLDYDIAKFGQEMAWEREKTRIASQMDIWTNPDLTPEEREKYGSMFDSGKFLK